MSAAIVLVVSVPRPTAPANSNMPAMINACQSFRVPEPTDVAKLRDEDEIESQANIFVSPHRRESFGGKFGNVSGISSCITHELATSLAPMPQATKKAARPPHTTIQSHLREERRRE